MDYFVRYLAYTDYHWDRFISFLPPPFPRILYHHVLALMTRSLLYVSATFYLCDSYSYYDSTRFYLFQYYSFPRTCILGIPASGGASKPSTCINRHLRRPRTPSWSSWIHHHSYLAPSRNRSHLLSHLRSRVGREPLC